MTQYENPSISYMLAEFVWIDRCPSLSQSALMIACLPHLRSTQAPTLLPKDGSFGFNTWPDGNEHKPKPQASNSPFRNLLVMLCTVSMSVYSLCAHNIPIASAVSYCTELEPPVKISPSSGCKYKGSHSKTSPSYASLCQISKSWSLFHETKHFTNLSGCTGTEFKAELWFATAFSRERRPVLLAVRWATDCIPCSALHRPLRWRWSVLLDNSPVKVHEDYWAEHIKTDHTNSITHLPGSRMTASGREGDRESKQTSFVLAVSRSKLVL